MPTPANSTNHTYCLSTNLTTFDDSEAYCNTLGGHLASWNSLEEQTEVGGSCSLPHSTQPSHFLLPGGSHVHASSLAASVPVYLTRVHMTCTHRTGLQCLLLLPQVEGYWINAGLLLPLFHNVYWLGGRLGDEDVWPNFKWVDNSPGINSSTYSHWGTPKGKAREPNEPETTHVLADGSLQYQKLWGWADAVPETPAVAMCEIQREQQLPAVLGESVIACCAVIS